MSQIKFYKYVIWSLVGLNMVILAFFLLTKPRPRHRPSPKKFQSEVIEIFRLNDQQVAVFRELADEHKQKMNEISEQQATLLLHYFENLADSSESVGKDRLLNQYQQSEKEKMEVTYRHFQDIKRLLSKDQLPYFKEFMAEFTERLLHRRKKIPPPPKDFD